MIALEAVGLLLFGLALVALVHHLSGDPEALAGEERARTQEVVILAWMRQQGPGARLAPSDVHEAFPGYPVTSVRRAMTSLTKMRTRERMTARGSTDRHMVRNGRT